MAAEGNIDPMHQFRVEPIVPLHIGPYDVSFTNSSAWMLAGLALIFGFMLLGMKRQLVPGRWQMAVEGLTGFIDNLARVNIDWRFTTADARIKLTRLYPVLKEQKAA